MFDKPLGPWEKPDCSDGEPEKNFPIPNNYERIRIPDFHHLWHSSVSLSPSQTYVFIIFSLSQHSACKLFSLDFMDGRWTVGLSPWIPQKSFCFSLVHSTPNLILYNILTYEIGNLFIAFLLFDSFHIYIAIPLSFITQQFTLMRKLYLFSDQISFYRFLISTPTKISPASNRLHCSLQAYTVQLITRLFQPHCK